MWIRNAHYTSLRRTELERVTIITERKVGRSDVKTVPTPTVKMTELLIVEMRTRMREQLRRQRADDVQMQQSTTLSL